jgi:hypothetical protein
MLVIVVAVSAHRQRIAKEAATRHISAIGRKKLMLPLVRQYDGATQNRLAKRSESMESVCNRIPWSFVQFLPPDAAAVAAAAASIQRV